MTLGSADKRSRQVRRSVLWLLLLSGLMVGFALGRLWPPPAQGAGTYQQLDRFSRVLGLIETDWVGEPNMEELIDGAIAGMVQRLDKYSRYVRGRNVAGAEQSAEPGVDFVNLGKNFYVRAVVPGSPAEHAPLSSGDRLLAIGAESASAWSLSQLHEHLRGEPGTTVTLVLERQGGERRVEVLRDSLERAPVSYWMWRPGYGYLRVKSFSDHAAAFARSALDEMGARAPLQGLVLDLRQNPGGLIGEGILIADLFLRQGTIVSSAGRQTEHRRTWTALANSPYEELDLVVVVDKATASTAEILAAALQENGRALIMGETTFGKGTLQNVYDLQGDAVLKLTVAAYATPKGRHLEGQGLSPDVIALAEFGSDSQASAHPSMLVDRIEEQAFTYLWNRRRSGGSPP